MNDLDKALAEISAIRSQMARGAEFHGFGPATLAMTGILALLAAAAQSLWLGDPARDIASYLVLWMGTAAVSLALIGVEAVTRSRRVHSGLAQEMLAAAVEQFLPSAAAGVLLTAVLLCFAPASLSLLPGLWQIVFSLGVFASCRFLPRQIFAVGVWYLVTGLFCLALAGGDQAFSPWAMGVPYGVGQLLIAAILQRQLGERDGQI